MLGTGLSSASARKRSRALVSLGESGGSNAILLAALVASRDWSAQVRTAAVRAAGQAIANGQLVTTWSVEALSPSLADPDPVVRAAAFDALAFPCAFDVVCAALALETYPAVRLRAFACLATIASYCMKLSSVERLPVLSRQSAVGHLDHAPTFDEVATEERDSCKWVNRDQVLAALGESEKQVPGRPCPQQSKSSLLESALAPGEYFGVLSDGVEDADAGARAHALRAAGYFAIMHTNEPCVTAAVDSLAVHALARDVDRDVRNEAVRALAARDGAPAPPEAASELVRELSMTDFETRERALSALAARPMVSLSAFRFVVESLEGHLARARGERSQEAEGYARCVLVTLETVVKSNVGLAHVVDLVRRPSDKLVPHFIP
jgi:hypothetical protein